MKATQRMGLRILQALKSGQMNKSDLCEAMGLHYSQINPTVAQLIREGKVIILGTIKHRRGRAPVYGLPGMTLKLEVKAVTGKGSGQIAGKITVGGGSRWGSQSGPWDWR